jgi:flagellar protein FliO/FliZ
VRRSTFTRSLAAALGGLLVLPATVLAADGEGTRLNLDQAAPKAAEHASGAGTLVRTIVGLAVVIGVIYGVTWVLRQVKASREDTATGNGLAPIASLPLGPNRALHLVRAGAEVVLVGAGEQGVVPIRTYTEQEARELGLISAGEDAAGDAPSPRGRGGGGLPRPRRDWLNQLRARTVLK